MFILIKKLDEAILNFEKSVGEKICLHLAE